MRQVALEAKTVIVGCGDVGCRIAKALIADHTAPTDINACVRSEQAAKRCTELGMVVHRMDFDDSGTSLNLEFLAGAKVYYLVPPQPEGEEDLRSRNIISQLKIQRVQPSKVVLISTTGVYGDCGGEWVTEETPTKPQTERGRRRLHAEHFWRSWSIEQSIALNTLRVPGIYANSRIPRARIARQTPVVRSEECGFTNRVHADDLARIAIAAMQKEIAGEVFNCSDGAPGKVSDYLQAAAAVVGLPALPEISLEQAQQTLSVGMLSYLGESRRISNTKMLQKLKVALLYPDFRIGLRH